MLNNISLKKSFLLVYFLLLNVSCYANDIESKRYFIGCKDINTNKINTKSASFVKNMLTNDLRAKYDFLEALGFDINRSIDYRHICGQIRNAPDHETMYASLQQLQQEMILQYNKISLHQYNEKLAKKLNAK